jgi:hypothetical protein
LRLGRHAEQRVDLWMKGIIFVSEFFMFLYFIIYLLFILIN